MNIESATYIYEHAVKSGIEAVIDGITCFVPLDADNRHYQEIMRQVDAGDLTIVDPGA